MGHYTERRKDDYFKAMAHAIVQAEKSRLCQVGGRWRPREELMLQLESKSSPGAQLPPPRRISPIARKAFYGSDEAHLQDRGILLYSKSPHLTGSHLKNASRRHLVFDQLSEYHL